MVRRAQRYRLILLHLQGRRVQVVLKDRYFQFLLLILELQVLPVARAVLVVLRFRLVLVVPVFLELQLDPVDLDNTNSDFV